MPSRPATLPIVVDSPTPEPGLGFGKYVDGIAAAILGGSPARYTVGLYGPWGSGKSSLLAGVETSLRQTETNRAPYVVTFDAWRYESAGSLLFPMLQSVKRVVEAERGRMGAAAGVLATALDRLLQRFEVSFLGVGLKYEKAAASDNENFLSPFEGLNEVSDGIGQGRRIVVLIDDLDRCSPEGVVSVLEAIHVLTDIKGFVFVLALDYDYLIQAIRRRYRKIDAHRFIEKIIQVPFHIPPARLEKSGALSDIVRSWEAEVKSPWFDGVAETSINDVIFWALRSNPRQVKRLFNTFLLARYMEWDNTSSPENTSLLFNVLGFQVAWPDEYRLLHTGVSTTHREAGDNATLNHVSAYKALVDDEEVEDELDEDRNRVLRYVRKLLPGTLTLEQLIPILDLTASVVDIDKGTDEASRTRLDNAFSQASAELLRLYDEVHDFAHSLGDDVADSPSVGFMGINRRIEGLKGSPTFLSIGLRPKAKREKLLLFLPIPVGHHLQEGFIRDVTLVGHHGHGGFEITLTPDDDVRLGQAKEFIRQSYDRLGA